MATAGKVTQGLQRRAGEPAPISPSEAWVVWSSVFLFNHGFQISRVLGFVRISIDEVNGLISE